MRIFKNLQLVITPKLHPSSDILTRNLTRSLKCLRIPMKFWSGDILGNLVHFDPGKIVPRNYIPRNGPSCPTLDLEWYFIDPGKNFGLPDDWGRTLSYLSTRRYVVACYWDPHVVRSHRQCYYLRTTNSVNQWCPHDELPRHNLKMKESGKVLHVSIQQNREGDKTLFYD